MIIENEVTHLFVVEIFLCEVVVHQELVEYFRPFCFSLKITHTYIG